jgi:starvation-inducible DNA-binding protein
MDSVLTETEEIRMPANFHLPLAVADRESAVELQAMLVELIDLALIGKQAHWNVVGPHFRSVHAEMDELVDAWRAMGDEVAERAVALGAAPDGQTEAVAGASEIEPLAPGRISDAEVIEELGRRLAAVVQRTQERVERVTQDPVTQDLLIGVCGALE